MCYWFQKYFFVKSLVSQTLPGVGLQSLKLVFHENNKVTSEELLVFCCGAASSTVISDFIYRNNYQARADAVASFAAKPKNAAPVPPAETAVRRRRLRNVSAR